MTTDPFTLTLALVAGIAIAAACGLRAFLPLLLLGLGARFFHLQLAAPTQWLASDPALVGLAVAATIEILGDKVPAVDHALDAAGTVVRPLAAMLATFGLLAHWPEPWAKLIAVMLGGAAFALHATKAKTRLGSTLFTLGLANPWISLFEDVLTTSLVALAILAPLVAAGLLVAVVMAVVRWRRKRRRRAASPSRA